MADDSNRKDEEYTPTSQSVTSEVDGRRLGSIRLDDTSGVDRGTSQEIDFVHRDHELPPFSKSGGGWRGGPDVLSHDPEIDSELREPRGRGAADLTPGPTTPEGNRRE